MVSSNCEFDNGQNESYASTELQNAVKMIARSSQEADFERVKTNTNGKLKLMQQALDRSTREDVEAIQQVPILQLLSARSSHLSKERQQKIH